jgi:hypothetical protein
MLLHDMRLRALPVLLLGGVMAVHIWYYFFLCDDAYIIFRYARNFALGRGLVFNVGERVEGYTSFLWTLQLAFGEWLHLSSEVLAPLLSVLYTAGTVGICGLFIFRQQRPRRWPVFLTVLLILATHRTWAIWATSGLETRSFTFFVLTAFYALTRAEQTLCQRTRVAWLGSVSFLLALATLSRPDAQILFPAFFAFVAATRRVNSEVMSIGV